ncbi:hypothetical protein V6N12_067487 [Hibiscus sabdariffa]|uniref:Uncharacterized protein n=1 Tax=Hibiscus sabdariffa TaxID=183260 RepID=A0ABR2B867_9ROSI
MRINKSGAIIQKLSADDYIVRNVEQFWWMTKKKVLREQIELMLYIYGPSTSTRHCSVRLSPIAENSPLLPPVESGPCLSPSVADHPLGPATDHRLGDQTKCDSEMESPEIVNWGFVVKN